MVDEGFIDSKSVYNEGLLQIQRLHNSWTRCNHFSTKGMFKQWRWELDVIWRELSYDTFKKNNGKKLVDLSDMDDSKAMKDLGVDIQKAFVSGNRSEIYRLLDKKEVFLRILQHRAGKGAKYEDEGEKMLE